MDNKIPLWVWLIGGFAVIAAAGSSNKKVRTAVIEKTSKAAAAVTEKAAEAVAAVKKAINFMQWTQSQKLDSLRPDFRSKVERVLARLKAKGYSPKIDFGWRSVEFQQELLKKGTTKTSFSWHNVTDEKGNPSALAADIIETKPNWNTKNPFWKDLGIAAKAEGLIWGGDWTSFKDYPHVQLYSDTQLASYKAKTLKAIV